VNSIWRSLTNNLQKNANSPVITWINSMARIELSGKTYLNAISKGANYLISHSELDQNTKIEINLNNHWQSSVWKMAGLISGIGLSDKSNYQFSFLESVDINKPFVLSKDPFGMPESNVPNEYENVSFEVRSYPDNFSPVYNIGETLATFNSVEFTFSDLVDQISQKVNEFRISGRYAVKIAIDHQKTLDSLYLQTLIPAFTEYSAVLIDEMDLPLEQLKAEKVTQLIQI